MRDYVSDLEMVRFRHQNLKKKTVTILIAEQFNEINT